MQQLARLIRCQELSNYWILAPLVCDPAEAVTLLLGSLQPHLRGLVNICSTHPDPIISPVNLSQLLPDATASWALKPRCYTGATTNVMTSWVLEVDMLQAAAQQAAQQGTSEVLSIPGGTAPLGGVSFGIAVIINPVTEGNMGSTIGLYSRALNLPSSMWCGFSFEIDTEPRSSALEAPRESGGAVTRASQVSGWQGWSDFFGVGPMAGGWDDAAWAAKGLPTSGELRLKLTVTSVHRPMTAASS